MPRTNENAKPRRCGSMILQPNDIVALTADEAAADIDNAVRTFCGKESNDSGQAPNNSSAAALPGRPHLSNIGGERASQTTAREADDPRGGGG